MSKAFTKDDAPDTLLVIPPRAPLPPDVPNYVTARGMTLLCAELAELQAERVQLSAESDDDAERARRLAVNAGRLAELGARMASATIVDARAQPRDEVRFGATVVMRTLSGEGVGEERRLTIVGVDEADPAAGRVAFLSPIARVMLGLHVGETAVLRTGRGEQELQVVALAYETL